jgi:hypothetical protein
MFCEELSQLSCLTCMDTRGKAFKWPTFTCWHSNPLGAIITGRNPPIVESDSLGGFAHPKESLNGLTFIRRKAVNGHD